MSTHDATEAATHVEVASPDAWERLAAGYDEFVAPGEEPFASEALRMVGLRAGESFLDVAAGTGGLSLPAARLGARVLATDWAPAMVARFEDRVRAEGLKNAEGRVMDCHGLDLGDDGFDVVGSQFGVMLVPDQMGALREMVRATKLGGRVVLVAYGSPAEFEALQFFIRALQSVSPGFEGLPDDPAPLEFQVADPEVLRARLAAAGLVNVEVATHHQERLELRSGQDCWNWLINSNPVVAIIVDEVAAGQHALLRDTLERLIRERAGGGDTAVLTARLNIGWGTKPRPA